MPYQILIFENIYILCPMGVNCNCEESFQNFGKTRPIFIKKCSVLSLKPINLWWRCTIITMVINPGGRNFASRLYMVVVVLRKDCHCTGVRVKSGPSAHLWFLVTEDRQFIIVLSVIKNVLRKMTDTLDVFTVRMRSRII